MYFQIRSALKTHQWQHPIVDQVSNLLHLLEILIFYLTSVTASRSDEIPIILLSNYIAGEFDLRRLYDFINWDLVEEVEDVLQHFKSFPELIHIYDIIIMCDFIPERNDEIAAKTLRCLGYNGFLICITFNKRQGIIDCFMENGANKVLDHDLTDEDIFALPKGYCNLSYLLLRVTP